MFIRLTLVVTLGFALVACSSSKSTQGIELHVDFAHVAGDASTTAMLPLTWTNDKNVSITLEQARIVIAALEIRTCDNQVASLWRSWLAPFSWVSIAKAHSTTDATRMGEPQVVNLATPFTNATNPAVSLGHFSPPPGSYCQIMITLGVLDEDAASADNQDLIGSSLQYKGTANTSPSAQAFDLSSDKTKLFALSFVDANGAPAPVELSSDHADATVTLELTVNRLFDNVSDVAMSDGLAMQLLSNVATAMHVAKPMR